MRQRGEIRMYDVPCQIQAQAQPIKALQRSRVQQLVRGRGEFRLTSKTTEAHEKTTAR